MDPNGREFGNSQMPVVAFYQQQTARASAAIPQNPPGQDPQDLSNVYNMNTVQIYRPNPVTPVAQREAYSYRREEGELPHYKSLTPNQIQYCAFVKSLKSRITGSTMMTEHDRDAILASLMSLKQEKLSLHGLGMETLPEPVVQLKNLVYLDLSCNLLSELPPGFGNLIRLEALNLEDNVFTRLPVVLGRCFNLKTLKLRGNPLPEQFIRASGKQNGAQELLTWILVESPPILTRPPGRTWILRPWLKYHAAENQLVFINVMSYNILFEKYATWNKFGWCSPRFLDWEYRKRLILAEITSFIGDIMTFQEVGTEAFERCFKPELAKANWLGIFAPKSRAAIMSKKEVDGCAIFYRSDRYTLIDRFVIEFGKLARHHAKGSMDMLKRAGSKDNIAVVALLRIQNFPDRHLLVCTTHLHWDPEYSDVKLVQTMILMRELQTIRDRCIASIGCRDIPLVLTGDFNSLPESGVVQYLTNGWIAHDHPDFRGLESYRASLGLLMGANPGDGYTHPFALENAYTEADLSSTNVTYGFKGIIDYIFYSKQHSACTAVMSGLDPAWMEENKIVGYPQQFVPSDHVSIIAQLLLFDRWSNRQAA